jgi:hypothetical protein
MEQTTTQRMELGYVRTLLLAAVLLLSNAVYLLGSSETQLVTKKKFCIKLAGA